VAEMVKDPVCGMEIDPEQAAGKSEHEGTTYYFCAEGCKKEFDADPAKYVGAAEAPAEPAAEAPAEAPPAEAAAERPKKWWEFWR
jgi:YHS domain-containing protein